MALLRKVDAVTVTVTVPDLDAGLAFYRDVLGHELRWRNDEAGQAALALPESDTELVLIDLSKGTYTTDDAGTVTGVE